MPKAKWEGKGFQKLATGPGSVPVLLPIKDLNWGKAKVISEDGYFRGMSQTAGDVVHKNMSKSLAKKLTAAFIKDIDQLFKKKHLKLKTRIHLCMESELNCPLTVYGITIIISIVPE